MALITCAGADVLDGAIHMPSRGAWWARLRLDTATAPSGKVTISADGGLSLAGFVAVSGVFCDVAQVQIVGGAGGLGKILTPAAWQNAQLRDPLNAIAGMTGESLSSTIDSSLLSIQLPAWTVVASNAARAIDELCGAASSTWRVLSDGSIWLGVETWPAQEMPNGSDLLEVYPGEGRYVIGVDTPSLAPGVALSGVGNVAAVDHWIRPHEVRTWAWV